MWRHRKRASRSQWVHVDQHTWVVGGALHTLSARQATRWLRGHWSIKNGVFWVRDISYAEDRHHARITAPALSTIRDVAINLIRNAVSSSSLMPGAFSPLALLGAFCSL